MDKQERIDAEMLLRWERFKVQVAEDAELRSDLRDAFQEMLPGLWLAEDHT